MKNSSKDFQNEVDALFSLPLGEFTSARNVLASRLKKEGQAGEAERVKALSKPSISAWAVNQLYWKHRPVFDRLLAIGQEFRKAQALQLSGKTSDTKGPRDTRRDILAELARLSADILRKGGHTAAPDTMRRITVTLEALSAYAAVPDAPPPGRLTEDVDPPGFDALTALFSSSGTPPTKSVESTRTAPDVRQRDQKTLDRRGVEEAREEKIADARASLQEAEGVLKEARTKAQTASVERKNTEQEKREAEERLAKARSELEETVRYANNKQVEEEAAKRAVENASRLVEKANSELRSLLRR